MNWCYWEEKEEKYNYLKNYNPLLSTFYCSFCLDRVHGIAIENFRLLKHHKANRTSYCLVSSYLSGELASWFEIDHELITDGCEAVSFVILVPHAFLQGQAMNVDAVELFAVRPGMLLFHITFSILFLITSSLFGL